MHVFRMWVSIGYVTWYIYKTLKTFKLPGILELQPRGVSWSDNTIRWLVLPPVSSSLHFWDGLIMYFSHRITPLTSNIRGHLLQLILPDMVDHTFMAFPIPLHSLDPMDHFCYFDVSKIIPKNMHYLLYVTFKPILRNLILLKKNFNWITLAPHIGKRNAMLSRITFLSFQNTPI